MSASRRFPAVDRHAYRSAPEAAIPLPCRGLSRFDGETQQVGANGSISPQERDCGVFGYQVATDSGHPTRRIVW